MGLEGVTSEKLKEQQNKMEYAIALESNQVEWNKVSNVE